MNFGEQLKALRLAAGKTVDQASAAEGVSPRTWSYWEANKNLPPTEVSALTQEALLGRWRQIASVKPTDPTEDTP